MDQVETAQMQFVWEISQDGTILASRNLSRNEFIIKIITSVINDIELPFETELRMYKSIASFLLLISQLLLSYYL